MVIVLLVILLVQAGSGLFSDDEIATVGPLAEKVSNAVVGKMSSFHYFNGWIIAATVGAYVLAIAYYWFGLKDNLVKPMWNGWRSVDAGVAQPPTRARGSRRCCWPRRGRRVLARRGLSAG